MAGRREVGGENTERRRVPIGIWIAFGILVGVAGLSLFTTAELIRAIEVADDTSLVMDSLKNVDASITDAESARRAYSITGDQAFFETYQRAKAKLHTTTSTISLYVADDDDLNALNTGLAPLVTRRIELLESAITKRKALGFDAARESDATREGARLHTEIRALVERMEAAEAHPQDAREHETARNVSFLRLAQEPAQFSVSCS